MNQAHRSNTVRAGALATTLATMAAAGGVTAAPAARRNHHKASHRYKGNSGFHTPGRTGWKGEKKARKAAAKRLKAQS